MHLAWWEGPVQNSLSSPSAPLIFFSLSLWPLYVLPDWPSWFNDLAQTGHSDRMGEKDSEKVNGSQKLKPAEWDSLLLTDQNSHILSFRFIFYFLHLFVTVSAIHSSLLLRYSHSFQPVTQNTCPIPSLHFKWSSLSPSLFLCTRFQSGYERSDRHAEWESVAKEPEDSISNRNTCARTQTHLRRAFIIFCYSNKANATKVLMMSLWCINWHSLLTNSSRIQTSHNTFMTLQPKSF